MVEGAVGVELLEGLLTAGLLTTVEGLSAVDGPASA